MSNRLVFWLGIIGVTFFVAAAILGGLLLENYNPISQFISESYAIDTPHGKVLRYFFYIPSGILMTIFSFVSIKKFPQSIFTKIGFLGLSIFYGVSTIVTGIFPCDKGCNKDFINPSISQIIHNLAGLSTYLFVPISIMIIGFGLHQSSKHRSLSKVAFSCGAICFVLIALLFSQILLHYEGLLQRIIESTFILWFVMCSLSIKKNDINQNAHLA